MDPCPFARLRVESLAIKPPTNSRSSSSGSSGIHPSTTPCYCKLTLKGFPSQTALLPLISGDGAPDSTTSAAGFRLDAAALRRIASPAVLRVSVYAGRAACGGGRKAIGSVEVRMDLRGAEGKAAVHESGWVSLDGKGKKETARLHLVVRSEPEPSFVFEFGGEPECSPVVYQVQGGKNQGIRQPVFSCRFTAERSARSRSLPSGFEVKTRGWLRRTLSGNMENRPSRDRKGWMVMIYDLSGSAVAAASIITPFVPSPGTDRVSRSNPGAWLILSPSTASTIESWKPWGRLEAWRERWGPADGLGYRFKLADAGPALAEGSVSARAGGEFLIGGGGAHMGFVMGSTVEGEGKESRPVVTVGAHHVTCMADAALFVALAAAVDLSMDACRLFSRRLRKELCSSADGHHHLD